MLHNVIIVTQSVTLVTVVTQYQSKAVVTEVCKQLQFSSTLGSHRMSPTNKNAHHMISPFYGILASRVASPPPTDHNETGNGIAIASPLSQYLSEAKTRFLYFISSIGVTFLISYMFSMELVFLFVKPFLAFERSFIFTELAEALYITIKVCIFVTLYLVSPLALYQAWCFLVPSLYRAERRRWGLFWVASLICLLISLLVVYVIVLPKIALVLLQFEVKRQALTIQLEARIGSYIDWSLKVFFVAALLCQWPIISLIVSRLKPFTSQIGKRNRKAALGLSIVIAALLSPPDLVSQWGIAACLFVWFETIRWLGMVQMRWGSV